MAVVEHGMDGIVFWPGEDHDRQLSVLAEELVPIVREELAKIRAPTRLIWLRGRAGPPGTRRPRTRVRARTR
ncbi:hypothetical protein GCM10023215_56170 [Pseudonocardia yuanmonensis]|uniref:Luciferase-like monooxygenase n=1 Tax=Pseudonocardia yuanmonensis TaxID=1095914 RepID=A0ABP8XKN6_9PSEU